MWARPSAGVGRGQLAGEHLRWGARKSSVSFKETENKVARAEEENTVTTGPSGEREQLAANAAEESSRQNLRLGGA